MLPPPEIRRRAGATPPGPVTPQSGPVIHAPPPPAGVRGRRQGTPRELAPLRPSCRAPWGRGVAARRPHWLGRRVSQSLGHGGGGGAGLPPSLSSGPFCQLRTPAPTAWVRRPSPAGPTAMLCYEDEGSWSLSFSGAGFLGLYHVGVTRCLSERAPHLLQGARRFYGSSSGALNAVSIIAGKSVGAWGMARAGGRGGTRAPRGRQGAERGVSGSRAWRSALRPLHPA